MAALGGDGLRLLSVSRPERQPESAALGGPGPGLCCWVSVFSCLSLACSYVGSLYVWKSELPRDHPAVIKRRFTSVLVVSSLSPLCVLLWRELTGIQPGTSLLTLMGFRLEGIFPAALLPLLLTMILFLGPLMQLSMDCPCDLADGLKVVLAPRSWARCLTDMRWLRNQVIAPLTEELVFRACMLPMLAPCTGLGPAVFTCPLFFGVAHFHHIFEQLRFRQSSVGSIFLSAAFQFSYTAVFGAYTAFLFIRTEELRTKAAALRTARTLPNNNDTPWVASSWASSSRAKTLKRKSLLGTSPCVALTQVHQVQSRLPSPSPPLPSAARLTVHPVTKTCTPSPSTPTPVSPGQERQLYHGHQ
ncbi:CAAX prenyl protease 2 isoform X1 [Panthera pardus]|uniref:CAAX prenyl protease 2 n=1 Tax=Panthera pardus TaxID=9691 RepID=A0A9V1DZ15_PANPR|nr:CAAX prenyl protease 2 isoform X1 [Panthera pardus]XP_058545771.1 CAAX prenyl protease 2 isoform X1 [Neofelis nebulosa]